MKKAALFLTILASFLAMTGFALAQAGDRYDLTWNTIDGGGHIFSAGEGYELGGSIGQPDAGALFSGGYSLAGGFWGEPTASHSLYLPLVLKNY